MGLFVGPERRYDTISSLRLGFCDKNRFVIEALNDSLCVRGSREGEP